MAISRKELEQWYDEEYCLAAVRQNGYALRYVERRFWPLFAGMICE